MGGKEPAPLLDNEAEPEPYKTLDTEVVVAPVVVLTAPLPIEAGPTGAPGIHPLTALTQK